MLAGGPAGRRAAGPGPDCHGGTAALETETYRYGHLIG
jgi:hypothetical protein